MQFARYAMDDWLVEGQVQAVCFHMKTTKARIY